MRTLILESGAEISGLKCEIIDDRGFGSDIISFTIRIGSRPFVLNFALSSFDISTFASLLELVSHGVGTFEGGTFEGLTVSIRAVCIDDSAGIGVELKLRDCNDEGDLQAFASLIFTEDEVDYIVETIRRDCR